MKLGDLKTWCCANVIGITLVGFGLWARGRACAEIGAAVTGLFLLAGLFSRWPMRWPKLTIAINALMLLFTVSILSFMLTKEGLFRLWIPVAMLVLVFTDAAIKDVTALSPCRTCGDTGLCLKQCGGVLIYCDGCNADGICPTCGIRKGVRIS